VADATDEDRAAAHEACAAAEHALDRQEVNAFSENGPRFHAVVLAPCRMPRRLRLLEGLWNATETYRSANRLDETGQKALQTEHQLLPHVFLAGDQQQLIEAAELHRQHLLAGAVIGMCPVADPPADQP